MAYSSRPRSRAAAGGPRRYAGRRSTATRKAPARRASSPQALRIVIEHQQPGAGRYPGVTAKLDPPKRKAKF